VGLKKEGVRYRDKKGVRKKEKVRKGGRRGREGGGKEEPLRR